MTSTGSSSQSLTTAVVIEEAQQLGLDRVGVVTKPGSEQGAFLAWWLAEGYHGEMAYLARTDAVDRRQDLRSTMDEFRSAIVVAQEYGGDHPGPEAEEPSRAIIARYARGRDYHRVLKARLLALSNRLEEVAGPINARAYVDTGPILERELAQRAGLGWFGKNTMLIHPRHGSYAFLGVLLTDLALDETEPFGQDHCGTCVRCLEACPTGALLGRTEAGAPVMDARLCISYLTIELRGPIPRDLRPAVGNRIFGCDICQECCPFTRTFSKPAREEAYAARGPGEPPSGVQVPPGASSAHPGTDSPSLTDLLLTALDESAWDAFSRGSAIRRAGRAGSCPQHLRWPGKLGITRGCARADDGADGHRPSGPWSRCVGSRPDRNGRGPVGTAGEVGGGGGRVGQE